MDKGQIVLFQTAEREMKIEVRLSNEADIITQGELQQELVISKMETTTHHGAVDGRTINELHYTLDPEDICGKGCINEAFRVLKERELRELGEYRTRRLVLEAWHHFNFHNT